MKSFMCRRRQKEKKRTRPYSLGEYRAPSISVKVGAGRSSPYRVGIEGKREGGQTPFSSRGGEK